jgi:hypothetical protein
MFCATNSVLVKTLLSSSKVPIASLIWVSVLELFHVLHSLMQHAAVEQKATILVKRSKNCQVSLCYLFECFRLSGFLP